MYIIPFGAPTTTPCFVSVSKTIPLRAYRRAQIVIELWTMYTLFRRHEINCRFKKLGRRHIKCQCPVWMDGYDLHGNRQRQSLKTRSWSHAQARVSAIEQGVALPGPGPSVAKAVAAYLDDCRARNLTNSTRVRYKTTLDAFCAYFDDGPLSRVNLERLGAFRQSRGETAGASAAKELQTIRSFLRFCVDREWIAGNPGAKLRAPVIDAQPTLPFSQPEIAAILAACSQIDNPNPREIPRARLRAMALVLLLLYSGFRISDAVKLHRSALDFATGKLLIRMMKTRTPLYTRIPADAVAALKALPVESVYFLWSGKSKLSTAVGSARRTIDCLMKLAGIEDGHPHRFRDTFSVSLLNNGADIRTVQLLLGHTSIRTTEKHYAPFVASSQKRLDEAVATLHFSGNLPDAHTSMDAKEHALGDAKGHLLPFPRPVRS